MLLVLHTSLDMLFYKFYQVLPHNITSASFARRIDCVVDQFNQTAPIAAEGKSHTKMADVAAFGCLLYTYLLLQGQSC
jgi:hypothetical protein